MRKAGTEQVLGLDLLRGFSAAIVMAYHLTYCIWVSTSSPALVLSDRPSFDVLGRTFNFGSVGVEIFFVISGYVISLSAEHATFPRFLRSRILRLLPVVLLGTAIISAIWLIMGRDAGSVLREAINGVFFWPFGPWPSGVYWTLQIEILFYALIGMLLLTSSFKRLDWLAIALGGVSASFWIVYWLNEVVSLGPVGGLVHDLALRRASSMILVQHGCLFALGMFIWLIFRFGLNAKRLLLAVFMAVGSIGEVAQEAVAQSAYMHDDIDPILPVTVWLAGVGSLIMSIVANGWLSVRAQALKPTIRLIGLTTFPLYLLHEPVGVFVLWLLEGTALSPGLKIAMAFSVVILVSMSIARYFEPRLRALLGAIIDVGLPFRKPSVAVSEKT